MTPNERKIRNNDDKMVSFDSEVEPRISSIVENATRYVTLVTPYLQLWRHLQIKIEKAIARGVEVRFLLRKDWVEDGGHTQNTWNERKKAEDLEWLQNHHIQMHKVDGLHAKIYINESTVLISSMNVTESSTNNSLEFAVLMDNPSEAEQFRNYVNELISNVPSIGSPTRKTLANASKTIESSNRRTASGSCIRCGGRIAFSIDRPLCPECFSIWAIYGDPDYQEKRCHSCGKSAPVTFNKPLCRSCYRA